MFIMLYVYSIVYILYGDLLCVVICTISGSVLSECIRLRIYMSCIKAQLSNCSNKHYIQLQNRKRNVMVWMVNKGVGSLGVGWLNFLYTHMLFSIDFPTNAHTLTIAPNMHFQFFVCTFNSMCESLPYVLNSKRTQQQQRQQ